MVPSSLVVDSLSLDPRFLSNRQRSRFVLYSSGTTGLPKSIAHGAGNTLLQVRGRPCVVSCRRRRRRPRQTPTVSFRTGASASTSFVPRDARALACDAADGGATTVGASQRKLRARVRVACVRVCMRVCACGCLTHQHKPRVRVCMRVCVSGHARVCVRGCLAHQRKLPARAAREGAHAPLRAPAAGPHALLHDLRLVRVVMSVSMTHGMVTTACSSARPAAGACRVRCQLAVMSVTMEHGMVTTSCSSTHDRARGARYHWNFGRRRATARLRRRASRGGAVARFASSRGGSRTSACRGARPSDAPSLSFRQRGALTLVSARARGLGVAVRGRARRWVARTLLDSNRSRRCLCRMMWNWMASSLFAGATVVTFDGFAAYPGLKAPWDLVEREQISHLGSSPRFLQASSPSPSPSSSSPDPHPHRSSSSPPSSSYPHPHHMLTSPPSSSYPYILIDLIIIIYPHHHHPHH